jgi:tripartite-type tricarboxylate transporter receptor subunit TctC
MLSSKTLPVQPAARRAASLAILASSLFAFALPAWSAGYPEKPIKIIVPYVAGGTADSLARYIAQGLTQSMGQPVIVDNRTGAGGVIGSEANAAAAPDGYTFTLISSSYTVNPSLYKLRFDPVKDITPVVQVSKGPMLVVANPALGAKSMEDLVRLAKASPEKITYASSGQGSVLHLAAALFADRAGVKMTHIPYKGGGAAVTDVLGNQVDLYFAGPTGVMPFVHTGKLTALGVTTAQRLPALPNVKTVAESGFPGYDVTLWYGLIGPKGLPPAVVERMNAEVNKILQRKETPAKLEVDGTYVAGGSAQQFGSIINQEITQWHGVVTKLGIKID